MHCLERGSDNETPRKQVTTYAIRCKQGLTTTYRCHIILYSISDNIYWLWLLRNTIVNCKTQLDAEWTRAKTNFTGAYHLRHCSGHQTFSYRTPKFFKYSGMQFEQISCTKYWMIKNIDVNKIHNWHITHYFKFKTRNFSCSDVWNSLAYPKLRTPALRPVVVTSLLSSVIGIVSAWHDTQREKLVSISCHLIVKSTAIVYIRVYIYIYSS